MGTPRPSVVSRRAFLQAAAIGSVSTTLSGCRGGDSRRTDLSQRATEPCLHPVRSRRPTRPSTYLSWKSVSINGAAARPLPWEDGWTFRAGEARLIFKRAGATGPVTELRYDTGGGHYVLRRK